MIILYSNKFNRKKLLRLNFNTISVLIKPKTMIQSFYPFDEHQAINNWFYKRKTRIIPNSNYLFKYIYKSKI